MRESGFDNVWAGDGRHAWPEAGFERLEPRLLFSADGLAALLDSGFERVTDVHGAGCACCGCGAGTVNQPLDAGHFVGDGHDHSLDHVLLRDGSGNTFFYDRAPLPEEGWVAEQAPTGGSDGQLAAVGSLPQLASKPGAAKTLYLDFNGQTIRNTFWNANYGGKAIHAAAYDRDGDPSTFNGSEMATIEDIWKRVAEDFAPFDVNVTTVSPGPAAFEAGGRAMRVMISTNVDDAAGGGTGAQWFGAAGGVAYLNSWNWSSDTPAWVFHNYLYSSKAIAEAVSHEVGHTFGLRHDGQVGGSAYYGGHGGGQTGWAPIMGVGYYRQTTQWSRGEYTNADNTENDLSRIASALGYRGDDHGDHRGIAGRLSVNAAGMATASGVISTSSDVDMFRFDSGGGNLSLNISSAGVGANLDILARLYDADGNQLAMSNPTMTLDASLSLALDAGRYYLSIEGTGFGSPSSGYSDYGSLGQYAISGNIPPVSGDDSGADAGADSPAAGGSVDPDRFEATGNQSRADSVKVIGKGTKKFKHLSLHDADDADWFKYWSTKNTKMRFVAKFAQSDGDLRLTLFNRQGEVIGSSDGSGAKEVIKLNMQRKDVAFLRVDSAAGEAVDDYKLIFRQAGKAKNKASSVAPDRLENDGNDSRGESEMVIGKGTRKLKHLSLHNADDADWFKYWSTRNTKLRFVAKFAQSDGDLRLTLFNRQGEVIGSSDGSGGREVIKHNMQRKDVAFLRVDSAAGDTVDDYKLIFRQTGGQNAGRTAVDEVVGGDVSRRDAMAAQAQQAARLAASNAIAAAQQMELLDEARGIGGQSDARLSGADRGGGERTNLPGLQPQDSSALMQRLRGGGGSVLARLMG